MWVTLEIYVWVIFLGEVGSIQGSTIKNMRRDDLSNYLISLEPMTRIELVTY